MFGEIGFAFLRILLELNHTYNGFTSAGIVKGLSEGQEKFNERQITGSGFRFPGPGKETTFGSGVMVGSAG